jgi:hypothetical protein
VKETSKLEIVGYCLIGLGILDFLLSWVGVNFTGFSEGPVVLGALGGILIYTAMTQAKAAALLASFESSLDEGETLLKSGTVGMMLSMTKQESGLLLLTNRKLVYSATGKVDGSGDMEEADDENAFQLLLGEILSVETSFKNLIIKDKKQNEHKLQSTGKKKWKEEILQAVSAAE